MAAYTGKSSSTMTLNEGPVYLQLKNPVVLFGKKSRGLVPGTSGLVSRGTILISLMIVNCVTAIVRRNSSPLSPPKAYTCEAYWDLVKCAIQSTNFTIRCVCAKSLDKRGKCSGSNLHSTSSLDIIASWPIACHWRPNNMGYIDKGLSLFLPWAPTKGPNLCKWICQSSVSTMSVRVPLGVPNTKI